MRKTHVLICGDVPSGRAELLAALRQAGDFELELAEPRPDPLAGREVLPDVLVLLLDAAWQEKLRALASRPATRRCPLIVIGPAVPDTAVEDPQLVRRAMQAGARDLFPATVAATELLEALRGIARELGAAPAVAAAHGTLTAVINAKGGSGASFVAVNLAHMTALQTGAPVALLDLDLQFGALPAAFDLDHRNSLLGALQSVDQLDPVALQGYMARHESGVHVLSAMFEQIPLAARAPADALARLLQLARESYAHVVVDLPRQLDGLAALTLGQATHNVVVMQQSLAHIRDAKRLLRAMTEQCAVARETLTLVLNRYSDKDPVREQDVRETVNPPVLVRLPNDFAVVSDSLNTGVPLQQLNPHAPVSRALFALAARLNGTGLRTTAPRRRRSLREALIVPFFGGGRA